MDIHSNILKVWGSELSLETLSRYVTAYKEYFAMYKITFNSKESFK